MEKFGQRTNTRSVLGASTSSTSVQFALIIGAIAIVTGLAVPFVYQQNAHRLAFDNSNIDRVVTGSIKKSKRYTIQKSILDNQ